MERAATIALAVRADEDEGLDRIADVRVLGGEPTPEGMRARLATPAGERIVLVRKRALEGRRPVSCGDEPSPAFAFEL